VDHEAREIIGCSLKLILGDLSVFEKNTVNYLKKILKYKRGGPMLLEGKLTHEPSICCTSNFEKIPNQEQNSIVSRATA
jgi:hypothetical protein